METRSGKADRRFLGEAVCPACDSLAEMVVTQH